MSLRPRLGELAALETLLDSEHDSAADLARDVFHEVSGMLAGREQWTVLVVKPAEVWAYGPFYSRNSAEKAVISGVLGVLGDARFLVRRMITGTTGGSDNA